LLSGNFGELRSDHFHAGIDFKTQNVEGKPVHAVQDGYVARIVVSPWGYGNALYINHPNGITTVYGHLQRFADRLAAYVKGQQYAQESFALDLSFPPEQFPVSKGQIIALAGNTGTSAGPHLHFEVRNTETGMLHDPLEYYKDRIKDTRAPGIEGFMAYPVEGKGVINGSSRKMEIKQTGSIEAWGEIALAVKAYDHMDGVSNIYGVRRIAMAIDTQVVFSSHIDCFPPAETRYINAFIDYEAWKTQRSFYMKTFVEPGNRLSFIKHINRGILHINEERIYHISFRLRDLYGNLAQHTLLIQGRKQDIPAPQTEGEYFHWKSENRFAAKGIRLTIPAGNLYDDIYFRYETQTSPIASDDVHILHNRPVPLHDKALLSLRLPTNASAAKEKYGVICLQGRRTVWIGGLHRDGWIDASIRELGHYTIMSDEQPPLITPVNPAAWINSRRITLRISDNLSGIQTYRGEIDGQFALFEFDGKKGLAVYRFDRTKLARGRHELCFTLTDACGNHSEYNHTFVW
jgi:murein DD-endopeptidase MepM/ murein hydrolase activator NlpD